MFDLTLYQKWGHLQLKENSHTVRNLMEKQLDVSVVQLLARLDINTHIVFVAAAETTTTQSKEDNEHKQALENPILVLSAA